MPRDETRTPWVVVFAVLGVCSAIGIAVVVGSDDGPVPPFLRADYTEPPAVSEPRRGDALRLAGSGSNLPLTNALAGRFANRVSQRPLVQTSIGSGGGIRALLDGAVDVALISRPLTASEAAHGLVATPYARAPVIVAVHANVPDPGLTRQELLDIFRGDKTAWSDGTRIVVLQREQGDSSHQAVATVLPEFDTINAEAYRAGRWRVLYHDASMQEALGSTPGAIGLHGSGGIEREEPYRAMAIDGVMPTLETVVSGEYPFFKDFAFVTIGPPTGEARAFIDFVHSDEGRAIITAAGCVPLPLREEP